VSAFVHQVALKPGADLDGFRRAARQLIAAQAQPESVVWASNPSADLFAASTVEAGAPLMLPKVVSELIAPVICHTAPERYALLYTLIWRVMRGERHLLEVASDPLVHRLHGMAKSVRRDIHKMHAFVRFREVGAAPDERFIAWFEPEHFIVEAVADFFVARFRGMEWAILTPKGSLHWNRRDLIIGPPAERNTAPDRDDFEGHWLDYYESTFNPARVNPTVMKGEMPVKYWKNLPEAALIPRLIQQATPRVQAMIARETQMPQKRTPHRAVAAMAEQGPASLEDLNRIILTSEPPAPFSPRAVLGEGPIGARLAFVGEQPGDQEDLQRRPFVGPAGRILDRAMAEAGIARNLAYVTNAVKNFKFKPSGKRRLHQSPTAGEVKHYRWWLERELEFVQPQLVVALGATATLAMAGKPLPIGKSRGPADFGAWKGFITVHPSYLLRLQGEAEKDAAYNAFVDDLKRASAMA
jgi:DNA polymerase